MEFTFLTSLVTITTCCVVVFYPELSNGTSTIVDVRLLNGKSVNEGLLEYMKQGDLSWSSPCSDQLDYDVASVVCTQLGYPGVNTIVEDWPLSYGITISLAINDKLECSGEEENLASCELSTLSRCSNPELAPGIICQENGYIGCYSYTAPFLDLRNPCDNGVQNLTIPKCISLCSFTNDSFTYAGLYNGDTCLCGDASPTFNQSETMEDWLTCNSPCIGRNGTPVEYCGGASHIALYNITLYLQNTKRNASPPGCQEITPSETEGTNSTNESTPSPFSSQSASSSSTPSSSLPLVQSSSSSSSSPTSSPTSSPKSSTSPSISLSSSTLLQSSQLSLSSSTLTFTSSSSADPPATDGSTRAQTTAERMSSSTLSNTDQTPGPGTTTAWTATGRMTSTALSNTAYSSSVMTSKSPTPRSQPGSTTSQRTTRPVKIPSNLGLYVGVGVGGGILILVVAVLLVIYISRCRQSKVKSSQRDLAILELRARPEGSDLGIYPSLPAPRNIYSLENGRISSAADDPNLDTGREENDYSMIVETGVNVGNASANGNAPGLRSPSESRKPPQPAPRKSLKDTQSAMHRDTSGLYSTPDKDQLGNGQCGSFPEYAVSQKFRKEPIGQEIHQVPPSASGPEDIDCLYTKPDKSSKAPASSTGIDKALYICRGDVDLQGDDQKGQSPSKYASEKDGIEVDGEDESDSDVEMIENELYGHSSHRLV